MVELGARTPCTGQAGEGLLPCTASQPHARRQAHLGDCTTPNILWLPATPLLAPPAACSLTIAVAGDIRPSEVRRLAEKYFGGWEQPASSLQPSACAASTGSGSGSGGGGAASAAAGAAAQREGLATPATPRSEWEYRAASLAGPAVMHAYFRPCINSPDAVPLDLARWVGGRGGWLGGWVAGQVSGSTGNGREGGRMC